MALENEKFMLFTTFRRDGRPVSTPVWLVHFSDGEIGFYSSTDSGKAKRLKHTPRVTLQACDFRGNNLHGPVYEGNARLVSGPELERIWSEVRRKYGIQPSITRFMATTVARLRGRRLRYGNVGVLVGQIRAA